MKKVLLSILLMLLPMLASADAVEINGIWYNLVPKAMNGVVAGTDSGYTQAPVPVTNRYHGPVPLIDP